MVPDKTDVRHGPTSFATFVNKHVAPPPGDRHRLRVCKYDSIAVSQFHIPATSNGIDDDCYAYAAIIITHEEGQRTIDYLHKGLTFL